MGNHVTLFSDEHKVEQLLINDLTIDRTNPSPMGTSIRWTALAEGKDLKYAWYIYKNGQYLKTIWYSDRNYLDWTPMELGNYSVKVWLKDCYDNYLSRLSQEHVVGVIYSANDVTLDQMLDVQMNQKPVTDLTGSWKRATRSQVLCFLNPSNFLNQYDRYQFVTLNYIHGITANDLNKILKNDLAGKGEVFLQVALKNNINPAYLVSHAILETGNGSSALAKGILVSEVNGEPVSEKAAYNIFGIGAYDDAPNKKGSEYAYNKGWFSLDQANFGGAEWISHNYINNTTFKQNTLYTMRWNPVIHWKQYATDIGWAYKQIKNLKWVLDQLQNAELIYVIPMYGAGPLAK